MICQIQLVVKSSERKLIMERTSAQQKWKFEKNIPFKIWHKYTSYRECTIKKHIFIKLDIRKVYHKDDIP